MSVKKYLSILFGTAFVFMVGYIIYKDIKEVPAAFAVFASMVSAVVGTYFGNSIAKGQ